MKYFLVVRVQVRPGSAAHRSRAGAAGAVFRRRAGATSAAGRRGARGHSRPDTLRRSRDHRRRRTRASASGKTQGLRHAAKRGHCRVRKRLRIRFAVALCGRSTRGWGYNDNVAITLSRMNFSSHVGRQTISGWMLTTDCCLVVASGLGLGLGLASDWLVALHTYLRYLPLSLYRARTKTDIYSKLTASVLSDAVLCY